jgi:hypothetical protein
MRIVAPPPIAGIGTIVQVDGDESQPDESRVEDFALQFDP